MKIYSHHGGYCLGDAVTLTDYLLRESVQSGQPAQLSKQFLPKAESKEVAYDLIRRWAAMCDSTGSIELVDDPGNFVTEQPKIWQNPRVPLKPHLRWDGGSSGRIALQLDGRSGGPHKNPPAHDLLRFLALPNTVHLGLPMTLEESIAVMRTCRFMISVCSGMSHVAHAVGIPLILVEYIQPVAMWHPDRDGPNGWTFAKGTQQAIAAAHVLMTKAPMHPPVPPSKPDLIYTFCRGAEYRRMAAILLATLRTKGAYTGEIAVLCPDGHDTGLEAACATAHAHYIPSPWMNEKANPWELDRVAALRYIADPDRFRTITLLDADIVCLGDINPMLDACHAQQRILHQEETWQVYRQCSAGHHLEMYLQAMTSAQRHEVRDKHPINAGALTWPGHMTVELRDAWLHLCLVAPHGHAKDQATLNAVLRFGGFPVAVYDAVTVGNASQTPRDTWRSYALLHFAGCSGRLNTMMQLAAGT